MVSIGKMKLKKPKKPSFLGKKSPKKERPKEKDQPGADADDEAATPTVKITPVENDPIMEDREDAAEDAGADQSPSASAEDDRKHVIDDEERTSPAPAPTPAADAEEDEEEEEEEEEPAVKAASDESVVTEANDVDAEDTLSTVKEEPSKEEAEEKAREDPAPAARKKRSMRTLDEEDTTLDATATSTVHEAGCTTPAHTSAFCGCF